MVKEVGGPALKTFEQKPYFWTEGAADGVHFRAPVTGKTTSGSKYPRSELRQMTPGGEKAAWSNKSQNWEMTAKLKFVKLPPGKPEVVALQIHDGDDLTTLRMEGTKLYVTLRNNSNWKKVRDPFALNRVINVKVLAKKGGGVFWYIDDMSNPVASIPGVFSSCYFKAGVYVQDNQGPSSEYGETVFYNLNVRKF